MYCAVRMFITHADARLSIQEELQQFSNRAASSRDIAVRLTLLELRHQINVWWNDDRGKQVHVHNNYFVF